MNNEVSRNNSAEGVTLVLGGTGKTGRRVAEKLQARGVKTRIASRSATQPFDWNDRRTWDAALEGVLDGCRDVAEHGRYSCVCREGGRDGCPAPRAAVGPWRKGGAGL